MKRSALTDIDVLRQYGDTYLVEYTPYGAKQDGKNERLWAIIWNYNGEDVWDKGASIEVSYKSAMHAFYRMAKVGVKKVEIEYDKIQNVEKDRVTGYCLVYSNDDCVDEYKFIYKPLSKTVKILFKSSDTYTEQERKSAEDYLLEKCEDTNFNSKSLTKYNVSGIKKELEATLKAFFDKRDPEMNDSQFSGIEYEVKDDAVVFEVYAEVGYSTLDKICEALDKVVQKYNSDAYFEPETSGRAVCYLWVPDENEEFRDSKPKKVKDEEPVTYYGLFQRGGSIGQNANAEYRRYGDGVLLEVYLDREEAKAKAKQYRKYLTPGERSYYGMGYTVKPLNKSDLKHPYVQKLIAELNKGTKVEDSDDWHERAHYELTFEDGHKERDTIPMYVKNGYTDEDILDYFQEYYDDKIVKVKQIGWSRMGDAKKVNVDKLKHYQINYTYEGQKDVFETYAETKEQAIKDLKKGYDEEELKVISVKVLDAKKVKDYKLRTIKTIKEAKDHIVAYIDMFLNNDDELTEKYEKKFKAIKKDSNALNNLGKKVLKFTKDNPEWQDEDLNEEIYKMLKSEAKNIKDAKSKKVKDSEQVGDDNREALEEYLEWEGIYGYTQDIVDAYEDEGAYIDGEYQDFDDAYDALNAYLEWEGIIGYTNAIYDILECGRDSIYYNDMVDERDSYN